MKKYTIIKTFPLASRLIAHLPNGQMKLIKYAEAHFVFDNDVMQYELFAVWSAMRDDTFAFAQIIPTDQNTYPEYFVSEGRIKYKRLYNEDLHPHITEALLEALFR